MGDKTIGLVASSIYWLYAVDQSYGPISSLTTLTITRLLYVARANKKGEKTRGLGAVAFAAGIKAELVSCVH
jgi:hypothetical protein